MCQTVWTQIRPNILSGLIWLQTVCQSYQQMTLVGKELSMHAQLSSGTRSLISGLRLSLLPYFVYAISKGYDETAQMHRLA